MNTVTTLHANGAVKERYSVNSSGMHGLYESWHENGSKHVVTFYINNQLDGKYEMFDPIGLVMRVGRYQQGHPIGFHTTFWPNTEIQKTVQCYNLSGQLDGYQVECDERGIIAQSTFYQCGVQTEPVSVAQYQDVELYYDTDEESDNDLPYQVDDITSQMHAHESTRMCSICLVDAEPRQCYTTHCNHVYCVGCLEQWLHQSTSCPICRTNLMNY